MTDTIHAMTSSTSVGVHLLWAYCHPDLAQKAIDKLFATWGNEATFKFAPYLSYEVRLVAVRNPDGGRTDMNDVIASKRAMELELAQAVAEFADVQRTVPGNEWMWERHDKERAEALGEAA